MRSADPLGEALPRAYGPEIVSLLAALSTDLTRLGEVPTAAILLESDRAIRGWLIEQAIEVVELPATSAWIDVRGAAMTSRWSDRQPAGRTRKLAELIHESPRFGQRLANAVNASAEVAGVQTAINLLVQPNRLPTRADVVAAGRWLPLIGERAYQAATRATMLSEALRSPAAHMAGQNAVKVALRLQWTVTSLAGQLFLFTSERGNRPWLLDLSAALDWQQWTPSLPLLRERSAWLCAIAAKCAAAFGGAQVEHYERKLQATPHAMELLDAIFGLTAIGLAEPEEASRIERIFASALQSVSSPVPPQILVEFLSSGLSALDRGDGRLVEGVRRRFGWSVPTNRGLATASALKSDALRPDREGFVPAFGTIGTAISSSIPDFFPESWLAGKARTAGLTDPDLQSLYGG